MAENNSTTYSKEFTVYVSRETVAKVRRFLMADSEDTYQGDDSSIVLAVPMGERHTFHISCHGRDDAPSYMEAELTDCGRTIQRIPYPSRKYLTGDWVLSCKEGSFKLTVEASTLRFMNGQVQDVHQGIIVHALSIDTSLYCPYLKGKKTADGAEIVVTPNQPDYWDGSWPAPDDFATGEAYFDLKKAGELLCCDGEECVCYFDPEKDMYVCHNEESNLTFLLTKEEFGICTFRPIHEKENH